MLLDYEIPPGGEKGPLVHTTNAGVFPMVDWRHRRIMLEESVITVIPQGASASTWNASSCGTLDVHSPALDARVSTPLVIEGSVRRPTGIDLDVTRIEAWSDGEQVGLAAEDQVLRRGSHSDFFLSIPTLPIGSHSLLLLAKLKNGSIAASVHLPLTVLPDPLTGDSSRGYQGSIDFPTGESLHSLPVTMRGWAVIPGSKNGHRSRVQSKSGKVLVRPANSLPWLYMALTALTSLKNLAILATPVAASLLNYPISLTGLWISTCMYATVSPASTQHLDSCSRHLPAEFPLQRAR